MITMKDIAREAGVSQPTVSYVLNGRAESARIAEKTQKKVLETAKRMGYCRDEVARSVKTGKSNIIAFITTSSNSESRANVLNGVMQAALESGYFVKILQVEVDVTADGVADICQGQRLAGVLSYGLTDQDFMSELGLALRSRDIPLAIVAGECFVKDSIHVRPNNEMGGRLAFQHFYSLGHRSLMCLNYSSDSKSFYIPCVKKSAPWAKARMTGFYDGAKKAGLSVGESKQSEHLFFKGDEIFKLLKKKLAPSAFYCLGDSGALALITKLIRGGVGIPEDLSVVGHGNISFSEYCEPSITTVNEHLFEVGHRAFELLFKRINLKDRKLVSGTYREKIDVELVIRESSGKNG